jgi:hypothetical protein
VAKQKPKSTDPIATGVIEFGALVEGKNVVRRFEPGDVVDLAPEDLEGLIKCGAVQQTAPQAAAELDPAVREAFMADAKKRYESTPALKKEFADFDAYLAALDKAA